MLFYENCLLADDSDEIAFRIFWKLGKMLENLFWCFRNYNVQEVSLKKEYTTKWKENMFDIMNHVRN